MVSKVGTKLDPLFVTPGWGDALDIQVDESTIVLTDVNVTKSVRAGIKLLGTRNILNITRSSFTQNGGSGVDLLETASEAYFDDITVSENVRHGIGCWCNKSQINIRGTSKE